LDANPWLVKRKRILIPQPEFLGAFLLNRAGETGIKELSEWEHGYSKLSITTPCLANVAKPFLGLNFHESLLKTYVV